MAWDATFRLGNQGNQGLPKRNAASSFPALPPHFPATLVTWGLFPAFDAARLGCQNRIGKGAFSSRKSQSPGFFGAKKPGALDAARRRVSGGLSYGSALKPSYVRILPGQGYQTTPRFAPVTLGRPSSPSETRRPTPSFASATLGYPSCLSETWRRLRHVS